MDPAAAVAKITSTPLIVTVIVTVLATLLIAVLIYWLMVRFVQRRTSYTYAETKRPVITTAYQQFKDDGFPSLANGRRFTFTFWMYIYDLERFRGVYRNVFFIGPENGNFTSSDSNRPNPPVSAILDKDRNDLHFFLGASSNGEALGTPASGIITVQGNNNARTDEKNVKYAVAERGITVEYIPLQRWVHVAIVVNETVNGGTIQAYMDGELVKNKSSSDNTGVKHTANNITRDVKLNLQKSMLSVSGSLNVGGSAALDNYSIGYSGLLSKVTIYNYDLNGKDIYNDYLKGPISDLMGRVGLGNYGIRSPLVPI